MCLLLLSKRFLIGLALSVFFLAIFLWRADVGDIWEALESANYLYIIPAVGMYLTSLMWRTLRWKIILSPMGDYPVSRLWPVVLVGYAANNVLPVRLGEFVRSYFLNIREGVSKTTGLATILIERVADGMALLLLVGVVAIFIPPVDLFRYLGELTHVPWLLLTMMLSVPFFSFAFLLVAMALWPEKVERFLTRAISHLPPRVRPMVSFLSSRFLEGLAALRQPSRLSKIIALSIPVWTFEASLFLLIALGFGLHEYEDITIWKLIGILILTTAASNLGTIIPSGGGGVGPFEFFAQATLVYFAVDVSEASAYVLVVHAALLVPVTFIGVGYAWLSNHSLTELARSSRESEERSQAAGEAGTA